MSYFVSLIDVHFQRTFRDDERNQGLYIQADASEVGARHFQFHI